ncbi:MAG: hypothetical protein KKB03_01130 [Nanoarchaeota archaeon]|nr:hypothetical protein [Nanoarchaeota archaeon]MBU1135858.1 hypothetical protein [Nanoarchaeota archaeon]MBU2519830.1 hypothetical protein [Nanoarchaeota archaeon]
MLDTEAIIKTYRGWDKLEKQNDIDIIDFDLIPPIEGEKFESREEVLEKLRYLHSEIKPENNQEEFIKAKVNASTYFLRALMGEEIPYYEYVENITGVRPQIIPEQDIQKQKQVMEALLREVGYKPDTESFEQFSSRIRVSKEEARQQVKSCEETIIPIVLESLGFNDLEFPHEVRFVEERDYWTGWTSTTPEGSFLLRYNFHPIHTWYRGDMENRTLHEVGGHFVQAANLKKGISRGEINPVIGVTTVQEPHTFAGEGIADTISCFLPEVEQALSLYGLLAREQRATRDYLQNNAHIWVNEGRNLDELVEYICDNHPFSTEERTRMNLENWKTNPSRKAYHYIYGISIYLHRQFQERLSPDKQKEYLRHAMSGYETPRQLMEFVDQLVEK